MSRVSYALLAIIVLATGCVSLIPSPTPPAVMSLPTAQASPNPTETPVTPTPVLPTATVSPSHLPKSTLILQPADFLEPAEVLPAPLYHLGSDGQIIRLERNGTTLIRATEEVAPVIDFDVSPVNGMLAYVSGNNLILADPYGGDIRVLVEGSIEPDEHCRIIQILTPVFSPTGVEIAFAMDGVHLVFAGGGDSELIQRNDPLGPGACTYSPVAHRPYSLHTGLHRLGEYPSGRGRTGICSSLGI